MRQHLATANAAPIASLTEIRDTLRTDLLRWAANANIVALVLLIAILPTALLLPESYGTIRYAPYVGALLSFMFAVPLPMLARRGLVGIRNGDIFGIDAFILADVLSTVFVHSIYDFLVKHGSVGAFVIEMASFLLLPPLVDLYAAAKRRMVREGWTD